MAGYVQLGAVRTWYQERGRGEPLVLLHGGMGDAADFAAIIDALAARFRVLVPERRGHGHTADVDGPITYQLMAQDTIAWFTDRRLVKLDPDLRGYAAYMFATEGQVVQIPGS
jgi:pimeloyl-ACP methyl ester carboxylesterase